MEGAGRAFLGERSRPPGSSTSDGALRFDVGSTSSLVFAAASAYFMSVHEMPDWQDLSRRAGTCSQKIAWHDWQLHSGSLLALEWLSWMTGNAGCR